MAMVAAFADHGALALALATALIDGPWLQMTTGLFDHYSVHRTT